MTTDRAALVESLAAALYLAHRSDWLTERGVGWDGIPEDTYVKDMCRSDARAVLPFIATLIERAEREAAEAALRQVAESFQKFVAAGHSLQGRVALLGVEQIIRQHRSALAGDSGAGLADPH